MFLERLLGLSLTRAQVERGRAFVAGVIEREGDEGLSRLWTSARAADATEVDAPGLWLARLEVDGDDPDAVLTAYRPERYRRASGSGGGRSSWSFSARRRSLTLERTRFPRASGAASRGCAASPRRTTRMPRRPAP